MVEGGFRAMASDCRIVVVGGTESLLAAARSRIEDLEARWSRFRPDSEVALLNGLPGVAVEVSPETLELVARAVHAWRATAGAFDPTILPALLAAGYDTSFASGLDSSSPRKAASASPGCEGIVVDPARNVVVLPPRTTIDPGGIGKGLAADIVVRELLAAGAAGAMVDLGGDIRASGTSPEGAGWIIGIADPFRPERDLARVRLADGAVATSSTLVQRWVRAGEPVHHLIDPAAGSPRRSAIVAVTVVAGAGWWAEVSTKHALALGPARAAAALAAAAALFVDATGRVFVTNGFEQVAA